jgi:hypothetical protein
VANNVIAITEFEEPASGIASYTAVQIVATIILFFFDIIFVKRAHPIWMLLLLSLFLAGAYYTSMDMKFGPDEHMTIEAAQAPLAVPDISPPPAPAADVAPPSSSGDSKEVPAPKLEEEVKLI